MSYRFSWILLLSGLTTHAQFTVGLAGGISSNSLHTDVSNRSATRLESGRGYYFDIPVQYKITAWLFAEAAPGLIRKNYTLVRTGDLQGVYVSSRNTYLQIPLSAHFVYGRTFQVFSNTGLYAAWWASARTRGRLPDIFSVSEIQGAGSTPTEDYRLSAYDTKYTFDSRRDKRFELGWMGSAGLQCRVLTEYIVFVACTYFHSQTDQQKKYSLGQMPQYNQTLTLAAGGRYLIK